MRMFKTQKTESGPAEKPSASATESKSGTEAGGQDESRAGYQPYTPVKQRTFHPDVPRPSNAPAATTTTGAAPATPDSLERGNTLIVGPNIRLKGEIAACDTLVVQGNIEASMDSRHIDIAEGGVFIGEAAVDTADIAGHFEGTITVRDCLSVRNSGQVRGSIRYGRLAVQDGGVLKGEIELIENGNSRSTKPGEAAKSPSTGGNGSKPANGSAGSHDTGSDKQVAAQN